MTSYIEKLVLRRAPPGFGADGRCIDCEGTIVSCSCPRCTEHGSLLDPSGDCKACVYLDEPAYIPGPIIEHCLDCGTMVPSDAKLCPRCRR